MKLRSLHNLKRNTVTDNNGNVIEANGNDANVPNEKAWERESLILSKHDFLSSFQRFTDWLRISSETLQAVDVSQLDEFTAIEIEIRYDKLKTIRDELFCEQQSELKRISLLYQHLLSFIPNQINSPDIDLKATRKNFSNLMMKSASQAELFESVVPLANDWEESKDVVTELLTRASERSVAFLSADVNDDSINELEDEAKLFLAEFSEKLPVRHIYVTSSESIGDFVTDAKWSSLEEEALTLRRLWEELVALFQQFLAKVAKAQESKFVSKKKEADRIERQLQKEAKQCCCLKPFRIVRLAEGKYTFGDSRIARLVRIHGSSVVVRVGGGWEFLMEFLTRNDPCRANMLSEAGFDSIDTALGLIPMNSSSNSYSLEITRRRGSAAEETSKVHCRRTSSRRGSGGDASLSLSKDSIETNSSHRTEDSNDQLSPRCYVGKSKSRIGNSILRRHSDISSSQQPCRGRSESECRLTPKDTSSPKPVTRRLTLVDRQNEYAAKRRSLSANFKVVTVTQ